MTISIDEVKYIAKLSKLKFTDEDANKMAGEFNSILKHFENLNSEDLIEVHDNLKETIKCTLRKDLVIKHLNKEELFQNVKKMRESYIEIPKVVE